MKIIPQELLHLLIGSTNIERLKVIKFGSVSKSRLNSVGGVGSVGSVDA